MPAKFLACAAVTLGALAAMTPAGMSPAPVSCVPGQVVAFLDADLLAMDAPRLRRHTTVVVRDGRVSAIDPATVPAGACRIMATGKVLMPGLADMHVHTSERELPLFLANGVTRIREMNGSPAHVALRERIARGELVGPRMLVASPLLVGMPLQYRHRLVTSAADARQAAREAKAAGYDYLKIYDGLSRESYDALVEEGAALHLPLDGHVPEDVGLERVLEAGQSLQHMDKMAFALGGHRGDTTGLAEARRLFSGRHPWVTPTLASLRALDAARTTEYTARLDAPEMAYMDSSSIAWWRSLAGTRTYAGHSSFYRFQLSLLPILRDSGARFLLGTDEGNPLMLPGFSVHDELAALVADGGFTRWEALQSATSSVGAFVGESGHDSLSGRIVPGAPADLILVDGNPLDDLAVLRRPAGVMAAGLWLDRDRLDAMLAKAMSH
jgi:Amidohydrolase family